MSGKIKQNHTYAELLKMEQRIFQKKAEKAVLHGFHKLVFKLSRSRDWLFIIAVLSIIANLLQAFKVL